MHMKNRLFWIAPVLMMILFVQCKDEAVSPVDQLIAEIENAQDKINIEPTFLPEPARALIAEEYFDTYVESAAHVPGKGYEVITGSEDRLYFRENGLELRGTLRGDRPGPCGRGIPVEVDELSSVITGYVAEHYPDAEILRAKQFPRGYVLLISGHRLLVFNNALEFVTETRAFYFCDKVGHPIDPANLPDAVTGYIDMHYPGAELAKAFLVRGRIVVGILTPDGRKILVFDQEGNFLFERG